MFEVKKSDVAPPPPAPERRKYPFASMEVNDCFDVPYEYPQTAGTVQNSIKSAARNHQLRHNQEFKVSMRRLSGETIIRVWRIS